MTVQPFQRGCDSSRTASERIDVAFTGHSNGSASEQFPFFWRPHTGGDHDPREIVTAFDDQCEGGMSRLGRCRIVKVRDEASESEYH